MRLSSWLRSAQFLFIPSDNGKEGLATRLGKRAKAAPLLFERLEDRTVPSTFMVETLSDSGMGSMRQAVLDANANPGADLIRFAPSARNGIITLTSGELNISDELKIDGPGAGWLAISGGDGSRIFKIGFGVLVSVDGLTVTHGRAVGQGGGILNAGNLSISHSILADNIAVGSPGATLGTVVDAFGGGIFNTGTLTVRDCAFVHNQSIGADGTSSTIGSSALGGAIMSSGTANAPATAIVGDSTFVENQAIGGDAGIGASRAGIGGAISNGASTFTVRQSVFRDNQAVGGVDNGVPGGFGAGAGGAIGNVARNGDAILAVSDSLFLGNRAIGGAAGTGGNAQIGRGGAIANYIFGGLTPPVTVTATASVIRSTLIGNQAIGGAGTTGGTGQGGGIANLNGGSLTISNSLIALNEAIGGDGNGGSGGGGLGGGIFNGGPSPVGTPVLMLQRCLVALNRAEGRGIDGQGQGGGLYLAAGGSASADPWTLIYANDASTSDDDVFGILV